MADLALSASGSTHSYTHDFQLDAELDPAYCFPGQADSNTALIPFSPSFSPMSLHPALEGDSEFLNGSGTPDGSEYWVHHPQLDPRLHSPQWSAMPTHHLGSWGAMMIPALDAPTPVSPCPAFDFRPSLPRILPRPSSPSEASSGRLSPLSVFSSSGASSPRASLDTAPKSCSHCDATTTPLWRRHPATHQPLCNACGLYLQQRNKMRPRVLISAEQEGEEEEDPGDGPECSHCHTRKTSVWRRSKSGAKVCNACGVYARLRGHDRPLSLRRNKIRPRCKHAKPKVFAS